MPGYGEYDEQAYNEAETPAQLAARRTRRRRRHGKKQGVMDGNIHGVGQSSEDHRGRWLPPASATSLSLAQLGIHVAPSEQTGDQDASHTLAKLGIQLGIYIDPPRMVSIAEGGNRNVVTMGDLGLFNSIPKPSPNSGASDLRHTGAAPPPPLQPPQQWLNRATPPLEHPCDHILAGPSPQLALPEQIPSMCYTTDQMPPVSYPVVPLRPAHQMPVPNQAAAWTEPDPALRHWLCSGQYGAQPIFDSPVESSVGMPSPPPIQSRVPAPPSAAPTSPVAQEFAKMIAEQDKQKAERSAQKIEEAESLEDLLQHLAAEAYQD